MAKTVGVRQLRNETSRIVRDVREGHAEYVITVSGEPAARLVPVEERERRIQEFLEEMDRLAVEVGKAWKSPLTAAEAVAEQRRQL